VPAPPAQTPGTWLRAGNLSLSDAECRKALAACGLDPDAFGNYSSVLKSQGAARKKLREDARNAAAAKGATPNPSHHVPPCSLEPGAENSGNCRCHEGEIAQDLCKNDPDKFLHANGQSGHMSQDALYRGAGGRGDPCQNIPPANDNSGTYGYGMSRARCMEHYGRSNLAGSPHEQICRAEEDFQADMASRGKGPLDVQDLREGVGRSAVVAATKGRYRVTDEGGLQKTSLDPAAAIEQKKYEEAQAAAAVGTGGNSAADANMSKDMPGLTEAEATAVKCIQMDWEKSLAAMQTEAMQQNVMGSAAGRKQAVAAYNAAGNTPKAKSWKDLPPSRRRTPSTPASASSPPRWATRLPRSNPRTPRAPKRTKPRRRRGASPTPLSGKASPPPTNARSTRPTGFT